MAILTKFTATDTAADVRDTLNAVLPKLSDVVAVPTGTGDDGAAIQSAIDNLAAGAGGVVYLGNTTWTISRALELDAAKIALVGHGATLNFIGTRDYAIHIFASNPANGKGVDVLECSGITINGVSTIDKGLYFYQASNPNQENGSKGFSRCRITGFNNNIYLANNAYIMSFRDCAIGAAANRCLVRTVNVNNGERITFDSCTFFGSPKFLDIIGVSSDWYFNNCSFDYPSLGFVNVASGDYTFTGCHFEGNSSGRPFEADNSAIVNFIGCFFGMTVNSDFMFTTYGNGAEYHLISCFQGLSGKTRIFSDPKNVICRDFSYGEGRQYQSLATTGTVVPDATRSQDWFVALSGDFKLDNPINGTRGTVQRFRLKADSTARNITYGTKIKGTNLVTQIPASGNLIVHAVYDAIDDIWDTTTVLRGA